MNKDREHVARNENELSKIILDCCFKIHTVLGPGLLESVYEEALVYELRKKNVMFERQVGIPVSYETITLELGFRADLVVENKVIIELKSVDTLKPIHKKQLLTYLKISDKKLGLLINFNAEMLKDGIVRIVNKL